MKLPGTSEQIFINERLISMKFFTLLNLTFLLLSSAYSQNFNKMIREKIVKDESYLDLKYIFESGKSLITYYSGQEIAFKEDIIPSRTDTISSSVRYVYKIFYFEKLTNNIKENIPLLIVENKITKRRKSRFDEIDPKPDTLSSVIVSPSQFRGDLDLTTNLIELILKREEEGKEHTTFDYYGKIKSTPQKPLDKNEFYIGFNQIINNHNYDSTKTDNWELELKGPVFPINASITIPELEEQLGLRNFGLELGMRQDKILNLLEFQNPIFTFGIFSRVSLSNDLFADVKILPQFKLPTNKIARWGMWPFFRFEPVEINKSPGIIIDGHLWGSIGDLTLPSLNIYYSKGRKNFDRPVFKNPNFFDSKFVYYSRIQWEVSASFYWNADKANFNKFKFDLGAGGYKIEKATYNAKNEFVNNIDMKRTPSVLPTVAIEYIHSSRHEAKDSTEIKFGLSVRYFDNRITFGTWLKLFKNIFGNDELRVEENYISELLGRKEADWEHPGSSSILLLVYRYGLN